MSNIPSRVGNGIPIVQAVDQAVAGTAFLLNGPASGEIVGVEGFSYGVTPFLSLAAGTSGTGVVNIEADSDFMIQAIQCAWNESGDTEVSLTTAPLVTLLLVDTGTGRQLMSQPIPLASISGTGQRPHYLITPKIMRARSALSVTVANYSAATTYDIRLSFEGRKIWRRS